MYSRLNAAIVAGMGAILVLLQLSMAQGELTILQQKRVHRHEGHAQAALEAAAYPLKLQGRAKGNQWASMGGIKRYGTTMKHL